MLDAVKSPIWPIMLKTIPIKIIFI
jgi:hypothetical protein